MFRWSFIFLLLMILAYIMGGCAGDPEPIKVGFVGSLSGPISDLSVSGRDGAVLAIEQFNKAGGLEGRPIQLVTRDDGHDRSQAREVVAELIAAETVAIIGPMTSSMARAMVPVINREEVLMISPTTSTSYLERSHDFFIRVYPGHWEKTALLSRYIIEEKELETLGVIYDLSNHEYTVDWYSRFRMPFINQGGEILVASPFTSGRHFNHQDLLQRVLDHDPEGLVFIAGAVDTARLTQQLRNLGSDLPVFVPAWAKTDELIQQGGTAVEGLMGAHFFDPQSKASEYLTFQEEYRDRFGKKPEFGAFFSYEALQVLLYALENTESWSGKGLRQVIINRGYYPGLQGDFFIDSYGDCQREEFMYRVEQGRFNRINY